MRLYILSLASATALAKATATVWPTVVLRLRRVALCKSPCKIAIILPGNANKRSTRPSAQNLCPIFCTSSLQGFTWHLPWSHKGFCRHYSSEVWAPQACHPQVRGELRTMALKSRSASNRSESLHNEDEKPSKLCKWSLERSCSWHESHQASAR